MNLHLGERMSKKTLYFEEAGRLYIVDQLSLAEISKRIPVSERTLRNWKEEGDWENKRREHISQKRSFHEELYDFTRELLTKVKEDIKSGQDPNSGQLYVLIKLLNQLTKVKDYEDKTVEPKEQKADINDLSKHIEEIIGA